jgi:dienelactone hydrolase
MKLYSLLLASIAFPGFSHIACSSQNNTPATFSAVPKPAIKVVNVTYSADNITMQGYVAYDSSIVGKRPVVLVVPEWWGFTDYVKRRARQLAALGYIAIAVDMYGDGKVADNPGDAGKWAAPFYKDPQMAKRHFDAALAKIKEFPEADVNNIAAIGYCFGGGMILNFARMGEDIKGVVSFHGSLIGVPANKNLLKAKILVCQGEDDKFVPPADREEFKKQLDSIGADYTFKSYPNATHAFTNPDATALGIKFSMPIAYNAEADVASWNDMQVFLKKIFH